LERDLRRQKLAVAARDYAEFLAENPDERDEMRRWAAAPLTKPVRRRKA
jgi:hypothetical protein